jgi:hypothetical protein
MTKHISLCALAVLVLTLASILHAQTVYTGTCDVSQISYTATDFVSESVVSTIFTDMPNSVFFFNVTNGGGCAKIDFSASIATKSASRLIFRILFDQDPKVVIVPAEISLPPQAEGGNVTASFILPLEDGLGAGNHNVRIQWRTPQPTTALSSNTRVVAYHN